MTGEWSRASRSFLIRPAFPRLASPLLQRPFFPRTLNRETLNDAVPPLLAVALSQLPDTYVTFTSRFNASAYVADGSHCAHPHTDLSAWEMFLIREKKEKQACDEFATFRRQFARDFWFKYTDPFVFRRRLRLSQRRMYFTNAKCSIFLILTKIRLTISSMCNSVDNCKKKLIFRFELHSVKILII